MKTPPADNTLRKRLSAEERKESITQAVIPVFAKKGFAATTTKELAQAAEVSEALLYRHFPSKESLYEYIQERICASESSIHEYINGLQPGVTTIIKIIYIIFKIIFEVKESHPLGSSIPRLMFQSLLEDGAFTRTFTEPRFAQMLPHIEESLEVARQNGEIIAGPVTAYECQWFPHHLAMALRMATLPDEPVFEYQSEVAERKHNAVWFCLRGLGMKEEIIQTHFIPQSLDPEVDAVLVKAGLRSPDSADIQLQDDFRGKI